MRPRLLRGNLQTNARRKIGHRFQKIQAVIFDQETDGVAVRATPKAVIKLLGLTYGKRRRLLAVKGAARGVICARFLERYVTFNDINNINPVQQLLNE